MNSIIKIKDLSFTYDKDNFIFRNLNVEFASGKCYGIFGKSGSGKSTLLSLLAGLETTKYGNIYYKNNDLSKVNLDKYRCNDIGIIFQSYNLLPQLTAIENVTLAMDISKIKLSNKDKKEKAIKLLNKVDIPEEKMNRKILQLSGGEQQRVAIARALSYNSKIILADEPTGNLDPEMEEEIIDILLNLAHQENKCVIIISHSKNIQQKVDTVYYLSNGKLKKEGENTI